MSRVVKDEAAASCSNSTVPVTVIPIKMFGLEKIAFLDNDNTNLQAVF